MSTAVTWEAAIAAGNRSRRRPPELEASLAQLRAASQLAEGARARLYRPVRGSLRIRLPERGSGDDTVRIFLSRDGRTAYERKPNQVSLDDLVHCHPMRTLSRRNGQTNKPVAFYSRSVGDLIVCESQHERRFAILADWNEDVVHIAAQPFTIDFPPDHALDSHTPDFALISGIGAVVIVDVKSPSKAGDAETMQRHALVKTALARAGMQHAVWSDAPRIITENLANFAAARVPDGMMREISPKMSGAYSPGIRVRSLLVAVSRLHCIPEATGLVVLRRMLWEHQFLIDTLVPFSLESELMRG